MNFDKVIDRGEFPALKWNKDLLIEHFGNENALPFSVADMDFLSPDAVIDSLRKRVEHGVFGYEYRKTELFDALVTWYKNRHRFLIDPDHVEFCSGVLNAISVLINQYSDEGDGIIVQPPVFFEFRSVIRSNHRRVIKNPLTVVDGTYHMDFEDLEKKAADPKNRILVICNPHNPVGRVWTREELSTAGEICLQHDILVVSDEIHGDIVYKPHRYTPFSSLSDEIVLNSATCLSPAKTFNIAGIVDAMALIANEEYRKRFRDFTRRYQIVQTNAFASAAIEAAYRDGGDWLDELLLYLRANIDFLHAYLRRNLPQVKMIEPEGTYLVWLDFEDLGMDAKALEQFLAHKAGLALNPGHWFGREGAGYARMNIACPQSTLHEGLSRLTDAVRNRR